MDTLHTLAPREGVASFDLFDTLMARRCIHAEEVFRIVAARVNAPGFVALRHHAQDLAIRRRAPADYALSDIYEELARLAGLSPGQAAALMALEIEVELEQVVPVAETLARVRAQDIVVSDMYLGAEVLGRILRERLGMRHNRLFVSCDGKASGRIWPELLRRYDITLHLGDNPVSDVARPAALGLATELTTLTAPSPMEQVLLAAGMPALGLAIREARLATWHPDPRLRALQLGQIQVNLPFLALVAQDLVHVVREAGARRLLLSGRDCHRLSYLVPALLARSGLDATATYFHSSRLARLRASGDYRAYLDAARGEERTVLADLCGTGASLHALLAAAGTGRTSLYLAHQYDSPDAVAAAPVEALLRGPEYPWLAFELLNRAPHPYVADMARWQDGFVPVFGQEPDATSLQDIAVQDEAFALAARLWVAAPQPDPLLPRAELRLLAHVVGLHASSTLDGSLEPLAGQQSAEEVGVREAMTALETAAG